MTKTTPIISKNEIDLRNSLTSMQILKEEVEKENLQLKEEITSSSIEASYNVSALRSTIVMLESELQEFKSGELKSLELEEEKVESQSEPEAPIVESQPEPEAPIVESQPEPEAPIEDEEEDICDDLKEARKLAELALKNNKEQLHKLKENESEIIIKRQSALFEQDEEEDKNDEEKQNN